MPILPNQFLNAKQGLANDSLHEMDIAMRNRRCRKMKRNVVDACEPLPNRFAYIMARGCRNLGRYAFLCGGEPFCHQTGPYQTLRAETWWSQLLVRFCVFFDFKKSWNHQNEGQNFRDVLFLEKKRPLPGMHHTEVRSGDGHQNPNIQISRYPDVQMSGYPDIRYQIPDIRYQVSEKWVKITKNQFFQKI